MTNSNTKQGIQEEWTFWSGDYGIIALKKSDVLNGVSPEKGIPIKDFIAQERKKAQVELIEKIEERLNLAIVYEKRGDMEIVVLSKIDLIWSLNALKEEGGEKI